MLLKYYLNVYNELPSFPNSDDLLHEIKTYLKKTEFSFIDMKTCLTFKINKKDWEIMINDLIERNRILKSGKDKFIINDEGN